MAEKHCEVFVYLCEQNQSVPQFGNIACAKNHLRTSDILSNLIESKRKAGSLEKLRIRDRLSSMSPLRNLFFSHSLTPWRSLRDLTKMSTSDSSVNNLDACKDLTGSTNHIDTDCVSPRVSSNSLASIQIDSLELNDSILGFNIQGECSSKSPILKNQNMENVGLIYSQKPLHSNLSKRKSTFTFSRSTSCPHVVPAIHLKRLENQPVRDDQVRCKQTLNQTAASTFMAPEINKALDSDIKSSHQNFRSNYKTSKIPRDESPSGKQENLPREDKGAKKSVQSAKSLARSKCMQWLNSLDEDD